MFLGAAKGLEILLELSNRLKSCWEFNKKFRLMELYQVISPKPIGTKQVNCTQLKRKADILISSFAEKDLRSWERS